MLGKIKRLFKKLITKKPRLSKFIFTGLILGVFLYGGLFAVVQPAEAVDVIGWTMDLVAQTISTVLLAIASLLGKLLVVVINILLGVVQYNDFIHSNAVDRGWEVVRDICNMFFVVILLIIAFGTILRIENYKYNKLLGKLIIMAILINFSKTIAGFLIDFGQVIMMTFVNAFADTAANNFVSILKLRGILDFVDTNPANTVGPTNWELIGMPILVILLLLVALMTMLAILVTFMVRIIILWILIVLSPLAYLLAAFPMTQKWSSQWWSKFGQWVTTGPILAFFIWLALLVSVGETAGVPIENAGIPALATGEVTASISAISSSENILGFMLAIAMFLISLSVASSLGGVAGSFAGNMASRVRKIPVQTLRAGAAPVKGLVGYGSRQLYRHTGFQTDPRLIVQGIKNDFNRRKIQDLRAGAAKAGDAMQEGGSMKNMIKGFTGASEDFSDYYFRGFLGNKGYLPSKDKAGNWRAGTLFRGATKGSGDVAEIRDQITEEEKERSIRQAEVDARVRPDQKVNQAQELVDKRAEEARFIHALENNELTDEHTDMIRDELEGINEDLNDIPKKDRSDSEDERHESLTKQKGQLEELLGGINDYDDLTKVSEEVLQELKTDRNEKINEIVDAKKGGDIATVDRLEGKLASEIKPNIEQLESAIKSLKDEKVKGNPEAIIKTGVLKNLDTMMASLGKDGASYSAARLHSLNELRNKARISREAQAEYLARGDTASANANKKQADKLEAEALKMAPSVRLSPELMPRWREKLSDELKVLDTELDANDAEGQGIAYRFKLAPIFDKEQESIDKEMDDRGNKIKALDAKAEAFRPPQAAIAMGIRRRGILEAKGKYSTTNEDEIMMLADNAVRSGNDEEFAAICLHAASVSHWNELLNHFQTPDMSQYFNKDGTYKDKTPWGEKISKHHQPVDKNGTYKASQAGTNAFIRDWFIKKSGMAEQDAFSIQNDISNAAEASGHWTTAGQSTGSKDGLFYQRSMEEQQGRNIIEMSKRDDEKLLREGNRLAWMAEEWNDPRDHNKGRRAKIAPIGIWMLDTKWKSIANNLPRGRFNNNTAMNLMSKYNWRIIKKIRDRKSGAEREGFVEFMRELEKYAGQAAAQKDRTAGEQADFYMDNASEIQDLVHDLHLSEGKGEDL